VCLPDDDPNDPYDFEWYIVAACWLHRHLTIGFDRCFVACIGVGYQHGKVQVPLSVGLAFGGKAALPGPSSATPDEQEDPISPKVCFSGIAGGCWQGGFRNRKEGDWWHSATLAFGEQVGVCLTYNALTWDIGKGDVGFLPKPYEWD
jgi:hypothetical protein